MSQEKSSFRYGYYINGVEVELPDMPEFIEVDRPSEIVIDWDEVKSPPPPSEGKAE